MSEETPFVAIGDEELGEPIGETIRCPHCGQTHSVEYGDKVLPDGTKEPSKLLGFYRCDAKGVPQAYLCAVDGKNIMRRFKP